MTNISNNPNPKESVQQKLPTPFGNNLSVSSNKGVQSAVETEYDSLLKKMDSKDQNSPMKSLEDFNQYRITKEKHVPDTPAFITIGSAKVAAASNITPVTAEAKAGKTAATSVMIAGAISKDGIVDGFKDLTVIPNLAGKAVIHFDTEQSEADQQYNLKTILRRAHLEHTPEYYHSYNIRTLQLDTYKQFVSDVCTLCNDEYAGIQLIVVDGCADFVKSVNDEEEAKDIIFYFTQLAEAYACPVILIIHLNENAGKNGDTMPRGHIGRQAVRKGYAQLNIAKEGDISTLQALRARKAGNADTPLIHFKYDTIKGYHVTMDADERKESMTAKKDMAARAHSEQLAGKIFKPPTALLHKDAISQIMKSTNKSEGTAKTYLKNMLGWEQIIHAEDKHYRLKIIEGQKGLERVNSDP